MPGARGSALGVARVLDTTTRERLGERLGKSTSIGGVVIVPPSFFMAAKDWWSSSMISSCFIAMKTPPILTNGKAISASIFIGATARETTMSYDSLNELWANDSARSAYTLVGCKSKDVTTSSRNTAFFLRDSMSSTWIVGQKILIGIPGNPAPLPISSNRCGGRAIGSGSNARRTLSESRKWRVSASSQVVTVVRFISLFVSTIKVKCFEIASF